MSAAAQGGLALFTGSGVDPVLVWVLRGFLAAIFARAGVAKLRAPGEFVSAIRGYALLPPALAVGVAAFLLLAEVALVPALLIAASAQAAALGAGVLLLVYAAAVGINLARGRRDIDCGCAGPGRRQSLHEWLLARNLLYVAVAAGAALAPVARPLFWLDALTVILAVSALTALAIAFDGLAALAPSLRRAGGSA